MQPFAPVRRPSVTAFAALTLCVVIASGSAQPPQSQLNRPAPVNKNGGGPNRPVVGPRPNQEHLAQWMDRHRGLSLEQQQAALLREPGFRQLPQETQQRSMNRLTQLNNMPAEQRRRILERNEAMEHLTQPQRQQVRETMQQYSSLPVDRRRLVSRAFRDLREMPDPQRQSILNSDRFRGQFTNDERSTLTNLLAVEPYLPVQRTNDNVNAGK
jgi:hypothetical protein